MKTVYIDRFKKAMLTLDKFNQILVFTMF